jgi:hypothetical protein
VKKHVTEKLKAHGYAIYYSLSHSDVRVTVLLSVKRAGGKATVAELSEDTGIGYTNVKRAVFGREQTYNDMSLIRTGLVTAVDAADTDALTISLTDKGIEMAKTIDEAGYEKTPENL